MVTTRRASLLERQRSESVAITEGPKFEIELEDEVRTQSVARGSPSLLRPTPQLASPEIKPAIDQCVDDEMFQALSSIAIKEEPVELNTHASQTPVTSNSDTGRFDLDFVALIGSRFPDRDSDEEHEDEYGSTSESSHFDSEAEDEEEEGRDTVGPMRSLAAPPVRGWGRTSSVGSVVSVEDAKLSIDEFMIDRTPFIADKENKLRFWQTLCIEFQLVRIELDPLPFDYRRHLSSNQARSMRRKYKRKSDKNEALPPIPQSCTAAKKLLQDKVHVNLVDYFAAREVPVTEGELKDYTHLLFPSREAAVMYSRKTKKYIPRGEAKAEWLQPLLMTMRKNARI